MANSADVNGGTTSLAVTFPGGSCMQAEVLATSCVDSIRCAAEEFLGGLPPASKLRLLQGSKVLEDSEAVSTLDPAAPLLGIVMRDTNVDLLLSAVASFKGYEEVLMRSTPGQDSRGPVTVGPFPTILHALEELGGQPPELSYMKLGPTSHGVETLEYNGDVGGLLLPSLDVAPLLKSLKAERLLKVTFSVGVNSDAFNNGLGILLEGSPELPPEHAKCDAKLATYTYNGYGLRDKARSNVVKFHPGMSNGQLRVEGVGGWGNQSVGFTPKAWQESGERLHTLKLTVAADGRNMVHIRGTEHEEWQKEWEQELFDGKHLPALFAWLDLRGDKPVFVGPISLSVDSWAQDPATVAQAS